MSKSHIPHRCWTSTKGNMETCTACSFSSHSFYMKDFSFNAKACDPLVRVLHILTIRISRHVDWYSILPHVVYSWRHIVIFLW